MGVEEEDEQNDGKKANNKSKHDKNDANKVGTLFARHLQKTNNTIFDDSLRDLDETRRTIQNRKNTPIAWKVYSFTLIFFLILTILFVVKIVIRIEFRTRFQDSISGLNYSFSVGYTLPTATYLARYMELIATDILFTSSTQATLDSKYSKANKSFAYAVEDGHSFQFGQEGA